MAASLTASAATYRISPEDDVQQAVDQLQAGDSLLFSAGAYTRKEAVTFENKHGSELRPIVIGPEPRRPSGSIRPTLNLWPMIGPTT